VALSDIKLCLSEGISQSASQQKIPLNIKNLKFCSSFLKEFWVDLKACLGLVLSSLLSSRKIEAGLSDYSWATPTSLLPLLCTNILVHDIQQCSTNKCACRIHLYSYLLSAIFVVSTKQYLSCPIVNILLM